MLKIEADVWNYALILSDSYLFFLNNISNRRHLETKQLIPSLPGIYATVKTARPREKEREKSNIRTLGRVQKVKSHSLGHECLIRIPKSARPPSPPPPPGITLIGALTQSCGKDYQKFCPGMGFKGKMEGQFTFPSGITNGMNYSSENSGMKRLPLEIFHFFQFNRLL